MIKELAYIRLEIKEMLWLLNQHMLHPLSPWHWWISGYICVFIIIPGIMLGCYFCGKRHEDIG